MSEEPASIVRLRRLGWANVVYLLPVILWGVYVRISFSGDGCGDHWPLCQGAVLPEARGHEVVIEFVHRITSALCGVFAIGQVVFARRLFPAGHPARRAAFATLVFVVIEGLVGAALVKLRLVAHDTSIARGYVMAIHLCNTFALLASATAFAERCRLERPQEGPRDVPLRIGFAWLLLVGTTGAVTALGDTLFPSQSFRAGLVADFDPSSHPFLQLRAFHPLFALGASAFLAYVAASRLPTSPTPVRRGWVILLVLVAGQVAVGFGNMLLGAPTVLQLVHVALADGIWITLTYLALVAGRHPGSPEISASSPAPASSR